MDRNVNVITDTKGNKIVFIKDIIFKGKRAVNWNDVKNYMEAYVGNFYEIADTKDMVYIGKELPDEYTGSRYTYSLKGANAKAKANAAQGVPEMIQIATGKHFRENSGEKHKRMPQMVGIGIIHVLLCRFTVKMRRLNDIMYIMHLCSYGMTLTEKCTFMML